MEQEKTLLDVKLLTPIEEHPRNKSPVQQWVDSLIDEHERDEDMPPIVEADQNDAEVESFSLGAEAPGVMCARPCPYVQVTAHCNGSDAGSHCSSMESLLEARKPDPEEMLLELGFGGCEEPDIISRIPKRFLRPSTMKGVNIDDFIKHQQMMVHQFQSGFSGYRGLTGPSHAMPSGIVGKIMGLLLEAEVGRQNQEAYQRAQHQQMRFMNGSVQHCQASQTQGGYSPKLARLARSLMIKMKSSKTEMSVLSPENRNWYESQGDKSPEPAGKRLIIGHRSYTFAKDGDLVEDIKDGRPERVSPKSVCANGKLENTEVQKSDHMYNQPSHNSNHSSNHYNEKSICTGSKSQILSGVEEDDEDGVNVSYITNISTSNSKSKLQSGSGQSAEDGSWLSSLSEFNDCNRSITENASSSARLFLESISANREARRGSFPEVRQAAEKRRASLLESWVLAEISKGFLQNEDLCSSCGSRKASATEDAGPSLKKNLLSSDFVETGSNPCLSLDYEGVDITSSRRQSLQSFAKKDISEWKQSHHTDEPVIGAPPRATSATLKQGLSLADEFESPHVTLVTGEGNPSCSVIAHEIMDQPTLVEDMCSCDGIEEKASVSGSTISDKHPQDKIEELCQEELEMEYKNLVLLSSQLQDGATVGDIASKEEFMTLDLERRKQQQLMMIEKALQLYHKRLKELDLRGHLRDLLAGQLLRVTDLLDSVTSPNALTIMKQMTSLLRYQEALRQELEMHESIDGRISDPKEV